MTQNWHNKALFIFPVSKANLNWLVVDWPDYGPGVDAEQGAARAGLTSTYWQGGGGSCTDTHCQWWICSGSYTYIFVFIHAYTCFLYLVIFCPNHLHTCIYLHIHADTYIDMQILTYTGIYWQGPGEGGEGGRHALTPTANSVRVRTSLGLPSLSWRLLPGLRLALAAWRLPFWAQNVN